MYAQFSRYLDSVSLLNKCLTGLTLQQENIGNAFQCHSRDFIFGIRIFEGEKAQRLDSLKVDRSDIVELQMLSSVNHLLSEQSCIFCRSNA